MPDLQSPMHINMYNAGVKRRSFSNRLKNAISVFSGKSNFYGLEWGDPESIPPLKMVKDNFLIPFVKNSSCVLEIGPGGGRWTRYMIDVEKYIAVDYHEELLDALKANFNRPNMTFIKNNGADFPGVKPGSVDFLFSFGVFVHLDKPIIDTYLKNIRNIINSESDVVIQYSDKTKPLGIKNKGFSENTPEAMRELIISNGYKIVQEDTQSIWHSAIVRFKLD